MSLCLPVPCRVSSIDGESRNFPEPSTDDSEIPVRERRCTDLRYLKIFVTSLTFLVISVSVAGIRGDLRRLVHGYDDHGNICGYQNEPIIGVNQTGLDFRNKKFLDVRRTNLNEVEKSCVKNCRTGYDSSSVIPRCRSNIRLDEVEALASFFEVICLDIALCWKEVTVLCFLSICLSGLIFTILRMIPAVVIWAILVLASVVCIGATIYTWTVFYLKRQSMNAYDYDGKRDESSIWLFAAIFVTLLTVVYFIMVATLRNKLNLVIAIFEEGGRTIAATPTLLLTPILTHLAMAILFCFLCLGLAWLQTSGSAEIDENGKVSFPINQFFKAMRWMLLFGFLWISQFLLAFQDMVIAGTVVEWYFTRVKASLINPVCRSLNMIVQYHLGSVAFGSLILAVIKFIKAIFTMLEKSLNSKNKGLFVLWKIIQCLFSCIESFLKFLNKYAYVMIVLYGEPFCASARKAADCIASNASRIAAVDGIGTFILFILELFISLGVTSIGLALFTNLEELNNIWVPVVLVFVFSYLCCHCFISVYEMAIDTIILCFCVDSQLNDGVNRPFYMSKNLMIFLKNTIRSSTETTLNNTTEDV